MIAGGDDARAVVRYALIGTALTVILIWALYLARGALLLIYVAALFAIGVSPLVKAVEHREQRLFGNRVPRWLAILTIYLLVLGFLVGVSLLVIPPLVSQMRDLWNELPARLHDAQQWLIDRGLLSRELSVGEAVQKAPVGGDAVGTIFGALWRVVGGVAGVVTILVLAFYFLVDADNLVNTFVRLFPKSKRRRVDEACRHVTTKLSAWLGGQLLLGGIIAVTAAVGLWLLGVPYFYVLALIAGIGELIPVVGPILSAIPAVAVALTVSPGVALGVAIYYTAQQQLENHVLVPRIMGRQVGVSSAAVIVSLLIGGSLLGVVGAILAVPTVAILHVLMLEFTPELSEK